MSCGRHFYARSPTSYPSHFAGTWFVQNWVSGGALSAFDMHHRGGDLSEQKSPAVCWNLNLFEFCCATPGSGVSCRAFKPDIIHCSSPGIMWFAALVYSRLLKKPLVYSYHTHVPEYMPRCVCLCCCCCQDVRGQWAF